MVNHDAFVVVLQFNTPPPRLLTVNVCAGGGASPCWLLNEKPKELNPIAGAGVDGVTSRFNAGIPDWSLDLDVGDTVEIGGASFAAKAWGIETIVGSSRMDVMQNPMRNNKHCRIFRRIARILLASQS